MTVVFELFPALILRIKETVVLLTLFHTRDGVYIVVPNSKIAKNKLINGSCDSFISRLQLPLKVAYENTTALVTERLF
ncbi:MAG: mechanosensitive ion channel domain-containing protein [Coleofasciculaceae cyanobacterium]